MKSKIFKDREALTSGYTPKLSPYRDYQLRRLIDAFTPILKESEPPVQVVAYGGIGVGKTMVARQMRHSLEFKACKEEASLRCIHIDCMKERTLGGIIRLLASLFSPTMPLRGYSLEETFLTAIREARAKRLRVLLIIDGADPIFKSNPKMAVLLSRMYEVSPKHTNPSLLITLRSLDVFSQMEPWAIRSLRKNVIEFDNYDRDQLEAILKYRVRYAFQRRALPKETLASCIDLASDQGGNMKYVLELLKKAGERAESSGRSVVTFNHISKAVEQISPSFTFEELEDLSTP